MPAAAITSSAHSDTIVPIIERSSNCVKLDSVAVNTVDALDDKVMLTECVCLLLES